MRTVQLTVLMTAVACCLFLGACDSSGSAATDASNTTEAPVATEAPTTTQALTTTSLVQLDDMLFGVWWPLDAVNDAVLRFDDEGRIFYLSTNPEEGTIQVVYRVEEDKLILSDGQGDLGIALYSIEGDVLTVTSLETEIVETYQRWQSSTPSDQLDDALFGSWYAPADGGTFEFYFDGLVRQTYWDDGTEEYVGFIRGYRVEDGRIAFTDEQGADQFSIPYSIDGGILTITDPYGDEHAFEFMGKAGSPL